MRLENQKQIENVTEEICIKIPHLRLKKHPPKQACVCTTKVLVKTLYLVTPPPTHTHTHTLHREVRVKVRTDSLKIP